MNSTGVITFRQEYTVGLDSDFMLSSSNGRMVVISTIWVVPHRISCFFINRDNSIDMPIYNEEFPKEYSLTSPIFNKKLPLLYVGIDPICARYTIDYNQKRIAITTDTIKLDIPAQDIDYSSWANCLVFSYAYVGPAGSAKGVKTIKVSSDGHFTTDTHWLDIHGGVNTDLSVSPDGRWAVVIGGGDPEMSIVGINDDGSMKLLQQIDFKDETRIFNPYEIHFTPNGRFLILYCDDSTDHYYIVSLSINQETGWATIVDMINYKKAPLLSGGENAAITPDGKFVVFANSATSEKIDLDVFHIEEDGKLTWLPDKKITILNAYISDMTFVPPWRETLAPPHGWLAH
ncbi:MAG: hypothetical protein NT106_09275 [Candidatus Sumerlaeota bacterium]|nr:hypothetical protein [Candidatus Sumerlaeota bacterium]